jgi:DNA-binding SARP family transcriptional activator
MLEFRILGPLEVVAEQGSLRLGGPKQRATLAILLLNANRVVSVDRLADDLYAGAAPVTAVTQVQRQISELRKLLGAEHTIETRAPGYVLRLTPEQLDLQRFERLAAEAATALHGGEPQQASDLMSEALGLWHGPALADVAFESFAQPAIERLEEIRLAALEQRIDANLALGRHAELVGELEQLVSEHPLQERFCAQLMLALYRAGRQSEALDVYRGFREQLVELLGLEPTPALQDLEHAILTHDASLAVGRVAPEHESVAVGAVLVVASAPDGLDALLAVAEPLALSPRRELIVARLLDDERDLERVAAAVNARRASLRAETRTAVFTTRDRADDILRLANANDAGVVLLDGPDGLDAERVPDALRAVFEGSAADVGVLFARRSASESGAGVFVPFGGGEHDWAALELGAWLASASSTPLRLVGTKADAPSGRRDASRLLADASLAVQRVVGVDTRPVLAEPTEHGLIAAVEGATCVVAGVSPRWRREGIGDARRALVRHARPPVLLVHRGPGPGGLAPRDSRTRFSWTLES